MMVPMATTGTVRVWHDEEGWGVVDSEPTPGGCWAHFGAVAVEGYGRLEEGQAVELEWEEAEQDGFSYRAVRVWPRGTRPHDRPAADGSAYRSTLTLSFDDTGDD
jgi:cold shock protein